MQEEKWFIETLKFLIVINHPICKKKTDIKLKTQVNLIIIFGINNNKKK